MTQAADFHPATLSARDVLRRCTRAAHERVEGASGLMSPHLTRAEYFLYLDGFLSFHRILEHDIGRHAAAIGRFGLAWEERRKVPRLERDLAVIGRGPSVVADANVVSLPTLAHAFGALYVIEGATLGGVVIGRHLQSVLGIGPDDGGAFFHGYGPATGARWKEFCAAMERALVGEDARAAAVEAANATFDRFAAYTEGATR